MRYIPLTTSYSSSPLKVRYNNSIYGIARQNATLSFEIETWSNLGTHGHHDLAIMYLNKVSINGPVVGGGFGAYFSIYLYREGSPMDYFHIEDDAYFTYPNTSIDFNIRKTQEILDPQESGTYWTLSVSYNSYYIEIDKQFGTFFYTDPHMITTVNLPIGI